MRHIKQSGFTLIEVIVAFTIGALLVGLTLPAMVQMYDSMKYRDAVRSVVTALHSTRYTAMTEGKLVDLIVVPAERQIQIGEGKVQQLAESISLTVHAAKEMSRGEGTAVIRFYPDGSASGGSIDVAHEAGQVVRVRVDWLLGKLTQEAYAPS